MSDLRCGTVKVYRENADGTGRHVVAGNRRYGVYRSPEMSRYRKDLVERSSRPKKEKK